jgi:hypothetical protein
MAKYLTLLGFWGLSALICLPAVIGGAASTVALMFLVLLVVFSAYLCSAWFAAFVDSLLGRSKAV